MNINDLRYNPHSNSLRAFAMIVGTIFALVVAVLLFDLRSRPLSVPDLLGFMATVSAPSALTVAWSERPSARRADAEFEDHLARFATGMQEEFGLGLPLYPLYDLKNGSGRSSNFTVGRSVYFYTSDSTGRIVLHRNAGAIVAPRQR